MAQSTPSGRIMKFRAWFERYGLVTVFVPALVPFPMPLKLFVVSAGVLRTRMSLFVGVVVLARVLRYGGDVWLGALLGHASLGFIEKHLWHFAVAGVLLFGALYLLVRFNDSSRRALQSHAGVSPGESAIRGDATVD